MNFLKRLFRRDSSGSCDCGVYLKRYVRKTCMGDMLRCEDIIDGKASVERFANVWEKDKASVMLMLTSLEYDFLGKEKYSDSEVDVMRHFLGNIALFFKTCYEEHQEDLLKKRSAEVKE